MRICIFFYLVLLLLLKQCILHEAQSILNLWVQTKNMALNIKRPDYRLDS